MRDAGLVEPPTGLPLPLGAPVHRVVVRAAQQPEPEGREILGHPRVRDQGPVVHAPEGVPRRRGRRRSRSRGSRTRSRHPGGGPPRRPVRAPGSARARSDATRCSRPRRPARSRPRPWWQVPDRYRARGRRDRPRAKGYAERQVFRRVALGTIGDHARAVPHPPPLSRRRRARRPPRRRAGRSEVEGPPAAGRERSRRARRRRPHGLGLGGRHGARRDPERHDRSAERRGDRSDPRRRRRRRRHAHDGRPPAASGPTSRPRPPRPTTRGGRGSTRIRSRWVSGRRSPACRSPTSCSSTRPTCAAPCIRRTAAPSPCSSCISGRVVATRHPDTGGAGGFSTTFPIHDVGIFRVRASFDAPDLLKAVPLHAARRPRRRRICTRAARSPFVLLFERRLRALHYHLVGVDRHFGSPTADAVMAFRKVQRMPRNQAVTDAVWRALASPSGSTPRSHADGFHIEVNQSRQVLYTVNDGDVEAIIHVEHRQAVHTHVRRHVLRQPEDRRVQPAPALLSELLRREPGDPRLAGRALVQREPRLCARPLLDGEVDLRPRRHRHEGHRLPLVGPVRSRPVGRRMCRPMSLTCPVARRTIDRSSQEGVRMAATNGSMKRSALVTRPRASTIPGIGVAMGGILGFAGVYLNWWRYEYPVPGGTITQYLARDGGLDRAGGLHRRDRRVRVRARVHALDRSADPEGDGRIDGDLVDLPARGRGRRLLPRRRRDRQPGAAGRAGG